jgi:hypothetical protein
MSKRILSVIAVAALAAAALAAAAALQIGVSDAAAQGRGPGGPGGAATPSTHVPSDPSKPLSATDAAGLAFMRQEEKLAHDVYTVLGDSYTLRVFDNIARSESRHVAAIQRLMSIYSVPDPVRHRCPRLLRRPCPDTALQGPDRSGSAVPGGSPAGRGDH